MPPPLTPDERRDRLVFYPVAVAGGVFSVTVLMTIAAAFGNSQAPITNWLNHHATSLLLWETGILVVVSILAMSLDRMRTLKRLRREQANSTLTESSNTPTDPGDQYVG